MEATLLTRVVLPVAIVVIMFGLGLTLVVHDFARVARYPRAVALGLGLQLAALPLIAYIIVKLFALSPVLAMGLMILAFSPAGATSNMISYLSKGDLALAVTLTALSSLVTPFTIPLLGQFFMARLMGSATEIAFPIGATIRQLVLVTLAPVALGMLVRQFVPRFAARVEQPIKILSLVFLFVVIAGVCIQTGSRLGGFFVATGLPALTLNVAALALGFFAARAAGIERRQAITLGIEVGVHNGTLALFVTGTLLNNPAMSIAPAIYSLIMFATAAAYGYLVNAGRGRQPELARTSTA
ncbi:MAG: bile acid:sodium symporter family protein [Gemmatimonadaceae bacterium]